MAERLIPLVPLSDNPTPRPTRPDTTGSSKLVPVPEPASVFSVGMQAVAGLNEGVLSWIDEPTAWAVRKMERHGLIDVAEGPTMLEWFNGGIPEAQTSMEKVAREGTSIVGQGTLLLFGGMFTALGRTGQFATSQIGQALNSQSLKNNMFRAVVEGFQRNPATNAAIETALTGVSGYAEETAKQLGTTDEQAAVVGMAAPFITVIPSFSPTVIAGKFITKAVKRLIRMNSDESARRLAAEQVQGALTPEAKAELARAEQNAASVGYEPGLAEASASPQLLAQQRMIESQAQGEQLDRLVNRKLRNMAAVRSFTERYAPEADHNPAVVVDTTNRRMENLTRSADRLEARATGQREAVAESLPNVDQAASGEAMRKRFADIRQAASERMTARAEALGINDNTVLFNREALQGEFARTFAPRSRFEDTSKVPAIVRRVLDDEAPGLSFQDLKSIRERLSDELLTALSGVNRDRALIRNLVRAKKVVDGFMTNVDNVQAIDGTDLKIIDNYRTFLTEYRTQFIERFERSAAYRIQGTKGTGEYRTVDEQVASAFFKPGGVTEARQFKAVFGEDREATMIMENVILDSFRNAAVRDGVINDRLARSWFRQNESVLREFPTIGAAINNRVERNAALLGRQAEIMDRRTAIENTRLARVLQRHGDDPDEVLERAIKDPALMAQLVGRQRTRAEREQLARAIWDKAVTKLQGAEMHNPALVEDFMDKNRRSLEMALGPEHMRNITMAYDAVPIIMRTHLTAGRARDTDPLGFMKEQIGQGFPQIQSRVFAAESGRISYRFQFGEAMSRLFQARARIRMRALYNEALFNPEVAKELAQLSLTRDFSQGSRHRARLNAFLFTMGISPFEDSDGSE